MAELDRDVSMDMDSQELYQQAGNLLRNAPNGSPMEPGEVQLEQRGNFARVGEGAEEDDEEELGDDEKNGDEVASGSNRKPPAGATDRPPSLTHSLCCRADLQSVPCWLQ